MAVLVPIRASIKVRWIARLHREYWPLALVLSIFGSALAVATGYSLVPSFLSLALISLCAYPAIRYMAEGTTTVPAAAILAAAYAAQFALPVFLGDGTLWIVGGFKTISEESLTGALLIAILGMVAFLAVFYSHIVTTFVDRLPSVELHLNRTRALMFCLLFGGLVLVMSRVFSTLSADYQTQLSALFRVLQTQMLVAIGVLAWLTYSSNSRWLRILYYVFVSAAVIEGLASGFLEAALIPVGIMFACEWVYTGRFNKGVAAALLGAALLLNPVKADFREAIWYSAYADPDASRLDKAVLWLQSGFKYWTDVIQGARAGEDAGFQLVRRTSMIDVVAHVYETTPALVPYLDGETYSYFAYSLIPRLLWPEKPVASANRTLAVEYGLTTVEGAERSTFGVSLIGEGYANFGIAGAIGIMVVLSLILRVIQRLFATEAAGPGGTALFLAFFAFFLNGLGSSAEILLGNLLQSMVASSILMYWVSERRRALAPSRRP